MLGNFNILKNALWKVKENKKYVFLNILFKNYFYSILYSDIK